MNRIAPLFRHLLAFFLCSPLVAFGADKKAIESDVCVYGGTSGGVAAAVQAARMGKSVVIVEPGKHLGGMTSGGLSAVDIGEPRSVGGIAREYFTKLAATVGRTLAWDKPFSSAAGGPATGGAYAIEPHKAENLFGEMARAAGAKVYFSARLASLRKDGARIVEFSTEDGRIFRARMFIDATYEGDLMAAAKVPYTTTREGNAKYNETYNGIHYTDKYAPRTDHKQPGSNGRVPGGQGAWDRDLPLDPYVVKGDPKSGLLPLIQEGEPGVQGEPAPGVQAYCFRLCLTTNKDNMIPIAPPPGYDAKRYEIVARFIEGCQAMGDDMDLRWFSKHDPLPNDKWDFNTATFGGNLPGASWEWPKAGYARRDQIAKEHENYHRGLLHFLATDPRVPEKVRKDMQRFGLPKDEFVDNGGWPHQLYIREARRMVSALVMTEHHTFGRVVAPKSVSLGSYGTDTHEIRRIVKGGVVVREGKTATGRGGAPPYPIGYDAIVPKQSECENLFVTFALSASHTAFSSIRMEPVFMVTSQSAATAACIAIDDKTPVQQVDYSKLSAQLRRDGQILEWAVETPAKKKGDVADNSAWEKQAVADAAQDRTVLVFDGVSPNKLACDTTLREMPDGSWAMVMLGGGDREPMPQNQVFITRSLDQGKTWSPMQPLEFGFERKGDTSAMVPSELMVHDGVCTLFVATHNGKFSGWKEWMIRSADSCRTWGKPAPAPGRLHERTFIRNHIVTRDGRLMLPYQHYLDAPGARNPRNGVIISSDGGKTWSVHGDIRLTDNDKYAGWAENNLVELSGGRIGMIIRADKLGGVLYYAESKDGGKTWPAFAAKTEIPNPGSKATLYPLAGGAVALLHNPNPLHRSPLALWVSFDGLKTWPYRRVLVPESCDGPTGRLNYPDGFVSKDGQYLHFAFDDNRHRAVYVAARLPSAAKGKWSGIVMDDGEGEYGGAWEESARVTPLVGAAYRHDNHQGQGEKSVRFTPVIPADGDYEVRLLYAPSSNRAHSVTVQIGSAAGEKTVALNQREACVVDGVPRALGVFPFKAGSGGHVKITNAGADGFVVVDGVQFVPAEIARAERAGKRDPGFAPAAKSADSFAEKREKMAAAVAVSPLAAKTDRDAKHDSGADHEPVQLAKEAKPAEIDGKTYDLVVIGGTGSGVACAVRAAREGCTVLLVQHNRHIGGMMTNGLMQWDALYGGPRAALFSELLGKIEQHYIRFSGKDSPDHQTIRYTHQHYPIGWAEPHVAEREFNRLVAGEKNVTLLLSHYPVALDRKGAILTGATLREYHSGAEIQVRASMFADATYEGDLFALAGAPYRVGREAKSEFDEPHAGKVFVNIDHGPAPTEAVEARLNIRPYSSKQGSMDPGSPFSADGAVQAYNYRFCVSRDPANRIMLTEPPPGYNREEYVNYERKGIATNSGPNLKSHMNSPILPGENHAYPEATWREREKIIERHKNFALGLIWFLQNDEATPPSRRAEFRQWGLPKDEFADNGHIPYEMYVREARRIVGRHVFTEHDNSLAPGLSRTPVFSDSIAITDWYMDSHSCTLDSRPGYRYDGKLILTEESRPAQIPYRSLLPQGVDNLLVPVCLSATHIAWGAIRLEPVWMQTGEAAGMAAALAKKEKTTPAGLNSELLLRTLVEHRQLVSFFNDMKVNAPEAWVPAAQYFGAKGFFHDYDVRAAEPLKAATAKVWAAGLRKLRDGSLDANELAREVAAAEQAESAPAKGAEFAVQAALDARAVDNKQPLTRGAALEWMWKSIR